MGGALSSEARAEATPASSTALGEYGLNGVGHIEPNRGQFDQGILAQAGARGIKINFREDSFDVITPGGDDSPAQGPPDGEGRPREAGPGSCLYHGGFCLKTPNIHTTTYSFVGARPGATTRFGEPLPGLTHYSGPRSSAVPPGGVERYGQFTYSGIYHGIDVVFRYSDAGHVEYDVVVHEGGNYRDFAVRSSGAGSEQIGADGSLRATVPGGEIIHSTPKLVGNPHSTARFDRQGSATRILLDGQVPPTPYVIDPEIIFSSYENPGDWDVNLRTVNDSEGSIYVAGYSSHVAGSNAFMQVRVTKFTRQDVSVPVPNWTKIFGGTQADLGLEIAISPDEKSIVVVGITASDDFIEVIEADPENEPDVNPLPNMRIVRGSQDAFVVRMKSGRDPLNRAEGAKIDFATYYGGDGVPRGGSWTGDLVDEAAQGVAIVEKAGRQEILVAGFTNSDSNFPVKDAIQPTYGGGTHDAFYARIVPDHPAPSQRLAYSSYLGGSGSAGGDDEYYDIRIAQDDVSNHFWVSGRTGSADFPVSASGVPQSTFQGGPSDYFVARFTDNGASAAGATYLGGDGAEIAPGSADFGEISTDLNIKNSKATIIGWNAAPTSTPLPTTPGALQPSPQGGRDAYLATLAPTPSDGLTLEYATYVGGSVNDFAGGLEIDSAGRFVIGGQTDSSDLPVTDLLGVSSCAGQAFVAVIDETRPAPRFLGCFGGSSVDTVEGVGLAQGVSGEVVEAVGWSMSDDFPTDPGTPPYLDFDSTSGGSPDGMVVRVDLSDVLYNYIAFSSNRADPGGQIFRIYVMADDGQNPTPVPSGGTGTRTFEQPAISPNGKRIAYVSAPSVGGQWDLWVMDKDGSNACQLTDSAAKEQRPVFSPDGEHIAYSSDMTVDREIYAVDLNQGAVCPTLGSLIEDKLTNVAPRFADSPTYSPDSGCIAYMAGIGLSTDIELASVGGICPASPITSDGLFNSYPAWSPATASSPEGRIAFASFRMATGEMAPPPDVRLWVWDSNGGVITGPLTTAPTTGTGASAPSWSPDGARLMAYASIASGDPDVYAMNADGTGHVNLIDASLCSTCTEGATDWWPSYGRGTVP